ncbi:PREDICTED: 28S ribosomal protein S5, mitochondrial [Polistes canadensis]|uniref:28S ribosomal protein S5, mitochondrial n=1 Tax=Polistes canadensis TaxID=91411 RepID=UPI000718BFBA|nr:PREDICTED: 28S ribosomal protein S5, mitochondrial [Polistes canadensis]XP_014610266.1 PREDICTED: 28S ribosomal protein S5, mitochondrial [Polistes canadensis]XP_014610267.1 PREDICTED: 28S ribosomal protein S5, mitochondrial [Polistes canadensis]
MASCILRFIGTFNSFKNYHVVENGSKIVSFMYNHNFLKTHIPVINSTRNTSFFNKRPAEQLWKGVTSVSNAGKRRGRARGVARRKDLNKGQIIGEGRIPIQFPGLNVPVIHGKEILRQHKLPEDPERQEKLIKLRESMSARKRVKLSPLERGWTSYRPGGMKIGPPEPVGDDTFEGFESWVLECKLVSTMTHNLGRKSRVSAMVVTGNGNGLAGYAVAKTKETKHALAVAKRRAGSKVVYINRYNNHTVVHDFYTQCGKTKIFVHKMYEGFGLVCHRAIKCCCEAIGIKDIYAKVEGAINYQNIIRAFFEGLLRQKSFQEMADEKQLHLVEFRKENDYFPVVVASPAQVRTSEQINPSEILDFSQYLMDGKVVLKRKKPPPFYTKLDSWNTHLKKMERIRNKKDVRMRLYAEYGDVRSFLAEKYPEAKAIFWSKKRVLAEKEAKENQ